MMPSFLSRKKNPPVTSIPPNRPVPPTSGLDITTISLPTFNQQNSVGSGNKSNTYQATYHADDSYYNQPSTYYAKEPKSQAMPQSRDHHSAGYPQSNAREWDKPSSRTSTPPPSQKASGYQPSIPRMPSIERLAMTSPPQQQQHRTASPSRISSQNKKTNEREYSSPQQTPQHHYSQRPGQYQSYNSRHSESDDERSSVVSSASSNVLEDAKDRASSATTVSSGVSSKSHYEDYAAPSSHSSDRTYVGSQAQSSHSGSHKGIPAPQAYVQQPAQYASRPQHSQPMITVPSNSTATMSANSPSLSTTSSMRKTSSRYALGDFNFMRTLGTGSFGRVHLVRSCHNTRYYAIKVLNKERVVKMKQVEHTNSEREMLERVRHPFLVNLWGTFKDPANLYMVMDFVSGGELFSLLRKSQRFPDPVAKFFAAEVALALDYLHSLDIIYRDLKPENILLAADGHVKITDFGFAKYVPDITWTLCGTPDYLAPEIVQSRGYNKSVDWYALGVLIFEMLAGYPPFFTEDTNPMRLYEKIIAGKVRYPQYFTMEAKDLLKNLLTSDLTKRYASPIYHFFSTGRTNESFSAEVDWERLYKKEIPAPYVPRVEGEGDSSCFEAYQEIDVAVEYGQPGPDPHMALFPLF